MASPRYMPCGDGAFMARKLHELPVYTKVVEFSRAVTATFHQGHLRRDAGLWHQIFRALDSIAANIEEGFEQGSDRGFARYLTISKGSAAELIGHLERAHQRGHLSARDLEALVARATEICRMLGGFIKYLHESDWKDRGRHSGSRPEKRSTAAD